MTRGLSVICARCDSEASSVLGFSAPMTMPGQERILEVRDVKLVESGWKEKQAPKPREGTHEDII
jgi:hypothetical protein